MKRLALLAYWATPLALGWPAARADNPVVQTCFTADPAPVVIDGAVYLYTGHDEDKATWFKMNDWRCFSSKDMVNWTDRGTPLSIKTFKWVRADAWAGQVIERNHKFYDYVPMNRKGGGMSIGVAVADAPAGPFKDALGKPLIGVGAGDIDPTVYIDDDGQAYLYWGNPQLRYVKLNEDMISFDPKVGIVDVPLTVESFGKRNRDPKRSTLYEEGPWFFKRNGLYYMVYAASGIPENIAYATSPGPTGPWTYKGIIMPTEGHSFTNHPGVLDYMGHSYFFYHNGALPGGGGFDRSVCIEEFKYNPDGSFPTIKMTKRGPDPVAHLNPYQQQEAATICWEQGIKTKPRAADRPGVYVTAVDADAYIKVASVDFGAKGTSKFLASVAATAEGNSIELRTDDPTGPVLGTLRVRPTGEAEKWQDQSVPVSPVTGIHDLYLLFHRGGDAAAPFNVDSWKFE